MYRPTVLLAVIATFAAISTAAEDDRPNVDGQCEVVAVQSPDRPNIIIIYTDDHGYADLGCQGVRSDIRTPHTDRLASEGVRFTAGYCSAPQCRPSRAGLMTGRYQNRFGLEENGDAALPWSERTIAERLRDAGYVTGMCGKWHLNGSVDSLGRLPDGSQATPAEVVGNYPERSSDDPGQVGSHGFMEYLSGPLRSYVATHTAAGRKLARPSVHPDRRYRLEVQAEWAANFIHRHARGETPFFLYVPFFAPHVPLEAPEKYLRRFPGEMPRRRRMALAMLSAVDDGVGLIAKALADEGAAENTLIFYISDNGAPLKLFKADKPGDGPGWDGSLNDPWIGEKGMLTEGGIRVPFIAHWPRRLPKSVVYDRPVITFDAVATALTAAGAPLDARIEGVDLLPYVTAQKTGDPHQALYWRWASQAAIREGDWKLLVGGSRRYLFHLASESHETENLLDRYPRRAERLHEKLKAWSETLINPGLPSENTRAAEVYLDFYLDGVAPPQ